jgi:hypothetical protein
MDSIRSKKLSNYFDFRLDDNQTDVIFRTWQANDASRT